MDEWVMETARLRLRHFIVEDCDFLIQLMNSEGWLAFIGDRNVKTLDQAQNYLKDRIMRSYEENKFGMYLVEQKTNGRPIGMCGLAKREFLNRPDIGFAFLEESSGQGFATESALAVVDYAKVILQIFILYAITLPQNLKSIRVLQKLDFNLQQTILSPEKEVLYLFSNKR